MCQVLVQAQGHKIHTPPPAQQLVGCVCAIMVFRMSLCNSCMANLKYHHAHMHIHLLYVRYIMYQIYCTAWWYFKFDMQELHKLMLKTMMAQTHPKSC